MGWHEVPPLFAVRREFIFLTGRNFLANPAAQPVCQMAGDIPNLRREWPFAGSVGSPVRSQHAHIEAY